jgi:peptidoglycan/LPS O-acetylase OafA/YrhL
MMITEHNNFDTLRLIAALAVLFSHSFPLTFGSDEFEPLYRLSGGQTTIGTAAVAVFFVISGFLITRSFERGGSSWSGGFRFIVARALRILPALFVVLVVLAFAIGPVLSSLSITEYLCNPQTFSFVGLNLSLVTFRDGLPGVLTNSPFPNSINGSLWTLKYEARCYFIILALGMLRILNWGVVGILLIAALSAVVLQFERYWLWELVAFFLGGAFLYLRPIPLDGRGALLSVAAIVGSLFFGGYNIVAPTFGSYLVIWLALSSAVRLPNLARYGDFSYGVYVYAFPVEQIVTMIMAANATWYWTGLISAPIALLLGCLSWKLVERPALALKGRLSRPAAKSPIDINRGRPHLQTGS